MSASTGNNSGKRKTVTLFVPGFSLHELGQICEVVGQQKSIPALDVLLSRGNYQRGNSTSIEQTLFDLFAVAKPAAEDFPIGALTRYLVKGETAENKWCMRADPVYIQPNREHLVLMGADGLDISLDDAERIVHDINQTYSDTEWQISALTPKQWIIEQSEQEQIKTHALSEVVGKNINDYLIKGNHVKKWHGLMNELQMFLHAHPVNQQRQMEGLPVINSLWFWGAGVLPAPAKDNTDLFAQCWSNETTSLSLARLTGVPRVDLPVHATAWLKQSITPGHHFLHIESLNNELVKNDPLEWWQSLNKFSEQWLVPLVAAIKQATIEELRLIDIDGSCRTLSRRLAKSWWKSLLWR